MKVNPITSTSWNSAWLSKRNAPHEDTLTSEDAEPEASVSKPLPTQVYTSRGELQAVGTPSSTFSKEA